MGEDRIDRILNGIDAVLGDEDEPALCWYCEERPGEPSTCLPCKSYLMSGGGDNPRLKPLPLSAADDLDFDFDLTPDDVLDAICDLVSDLGTRIGAEARKIRRSPQDGRRTD